MKKYSFALLAVVFAMASAFTVERPFQLFKFNGNPNSWNDRVNPAMYSTATSSCTVIEEQHCALDAANDGSGHPVIGASGPLYNALKNAPTLTDPDFSYSGIRGTEED